MIYMAVITNVPHDPFKEEIAGSMIVVSDTDLQKAYSLFSQAIKESGYRKVVSVEIKISQTPHIDQGGLVYLIYGTPVKDILTID